MAPKKGKAMSLIRRLPLAAVLLLAGNLIPDPAHAGVITLDVSGTMTPESGLGACSPICTLGGDIEFDTTTGNLESVDITATGFSPAVGTFTMTGSIVALGATLTQLELTAGANELILEFTTPTG